MSKLKLNLEDTVRYLSEYYKAGGGFNIKDIKPNTDDWESWEDGLYAVGGEGNFKFYYKDNDRLTDLGQGLKGDKGNTGTPGIDGKDGKDGKDGERGRQGYPGPAGKNGLGINTLSDVELLNEKEYNADVVYSDNTASIRGISTFTYDSDVKKDVPATLNIPIKGSGPIVVNADATSKNIEIAIDETGAAVGNVLTYTNEGIKWENNDNGTHVLVDGKFQDTWNADTKLDLIEPITNQTEFVTIAKNDEGFKQVQKVGTFTPQTSYRDYMPVLRGLDGQVKGQTPPAENQTELDLINRGELTEKLSDYIPKIVPEGKYCVYTQRPKDINDKPGDIEMIPYSSYDLVNTIAYRGADGVLRGKTASENQTDCDLINRGELTQKLKDKVSISGNPNVVYGNVNDGALPKPSAIYYTAYNDYLGVSIVSRNSEGYFQVRDPIQELHPTNKKYVDNALSGKLNKMTDAYIIYGTDKNGNQKEYRVTSSASRGDQIPIYDSTSGEAVLRTNTPQGYLDCTNKKYVDDALANLKSEIKTYIDEKLANK